MAEGGAAVHAARGLRAEQVGVLLGRQLGQHLAPVLGALLHRPVRDRAPVRRRLTIKLSFPEACTACTCEELCMPNTPCTLAML